MVQDGMVQVVHTVDDVAAWIQRQLPGRVILDGGIYAGRSGQRSTLCCYFRAWITDGAPTVADAETSKPPMCFSVSRRNSRGR